MTVLGAPSVDAYDHVSADFEYTSQTFEPSAGSDTTLQGAAARALVQRYVAKDVGVRAALGGSRVLSADGNQSAALENESGFTASAGATFLLPRIWRPLGWAITADAEYGHGLPLSPTLAPSALREEHSGAAGLGLAFADMVQVVPVRAHARYVHSIGSESDAAGTIDVGLGIGTDFRWIHSCGGPHIPIALRADYRFQTALLGDEHREHDVGGGLYYLRRSGTRIGAEVRARFAELEGDSQSRSISGVLRVDYYWESNW